MQCDALSPGNRATVLVAYEVTALEHLPHAQDLPTIAL